MPQRKAILSFSRPGSQPATLPGFEHRAEVRRERKQAEANPGAVGKQSRAGTGQPRDRRDRDNCKASGAG